MDKLQKLSPTPKVSVGAFAGALGGLVVWGLNEYAGAGMGPTETTMVVIVFTFIAQYTMGRGTT